MDTQYEISFKILIVDGEWNVKEQFALYGVDSLIRSLDDLNQRDIPYFVCRKKPVSLYDLDENPFWEKKADWDEEHRIRFNTPLDDSFFNIDFINVKSAEGEPLIGSARLSLRDLVLGDRAVEKKLVLTCPSGSPIGEVTMMVAVRRVENPLPPEKTVTVDYEEERAVDDFDEDDLT